MQSINKPEHENLTLPYRSMHFVESHSHTDLPHSLHHVFTHTRTHTSASFLYHVSIVSCIIVSRGVLKWFQVESFPSARSLARHARSFDLTVAREQAVNQYMFG